MERILKSEIQTINNIKGFTTEVFGVSTINPSIRAVDWRNFNKSNARIFSDLLSHINNGPLTRKERYGEFLGRLISGMFKQRQDILHVRTPRDMKLDGGLDIISDDPKTNWKKLFDWFSKKFNEKGEQNIFLLIDSPEVLFYPHKNRHLTAIPQHVDREKRVIKIIFVRKNKLDSKMISEIEKIPEVLSGKIKLVDIDQL